LIQQQKRGGGKKGKAGPASQKTLLIKGRRKRGRTNVWNPGPRPLREKKSLMAAKSPQTKRKKREGGRKAG